MKKKFIAVVMCAVLLTGCSKANDNTTEKDAQIQSLTNENITLKSKNKELTTANSDINASLAQYEQELTSLQKEYDELTSETKPYLDLSENEREAFVETAKQAAQQKEEETREEEAKGYNTGITYEQLSRYPDDYKGKKVKFSGSVLQILEGTSSNSIRMSTNGAYDDVILASYSKSMVNGRLLEGDEVVIYGKYAGLYTYTTVMGSSLTVPLVIVDIISLDGELDLGDETPTPTEPVSYPVIYDDAYVSIEYCGIERNSGKDCVVLMVENKNAFAIEAWSATFALDGIDLGDIWGSGDVSPNSKGKVYFYKSDKSSIDNKTPSTISGSLTINSKGDEKINGKKYCDISFSSSEI